MLVAGARYFNTLDQQSAYMQVPMHPDDAHMTAFTTPFGVYEQRRMSFGLRNAPAIFQRFMKATFREKMCSAHPVVLSRVFPDNFRTHSLSRHCVYDVAGVWTKAGIAEV